MIYIKKTLITHRKHTPQDAIYFLFSQLWEMTLIKLTFKDLNEFFLDYWLDNKIGYNAEMFCSLNIMRRYG